MRRTILLAITAALVLLASPAYAQADKDCDEFTSHDQAQAYFKAAGGSATNNVDRLDGDSDGVACEDHTYRSTPDQAGQPGTSGDEKLPFTGPRDATAPLAAILLAAGALLLLATRYRGHHAR